jgi:1-acyl-sn-glycerol-3-phosphate acyltransferase
MNLQTLLFFLVLVPIMIAGMTLALLLNLIDPSGDSFHKMAAWWGRLSAKLLGIDIDITGADHYRSDSTYLVVSNHSGMADIPLILGSINLNIRFVAKEELGRIPVFGWALKTGGYVMIKRGQNREALKSLLDAAETLKKGRSVHIFPEGTRSANGKLQPFKRGAFIIAKKTDKPVLPVTIIGSHLITPKKSLKIRHGKIRLIIGEPLQASHFKSAEELMEAAYRIISDNIDRYGNN